MYEKFDGKKYVLDDIFGYYGDIQFFDVVYGDVITDYYGDIDGKFKDDKIPEDLKDFFNHYYDILFGDLEDNKE